MPRSPLAESFTLEGTGAGRLLVRRALPRTGGEPYWHSCRLATFQAVARAAQAAGSDGFTYTELKETLHLPFSQIATAMAFLRNRGITELRSPRRNFAATRTVYLDAMTEFRGLRKGTRD